MCYFWLKWLYTRIFRAHQPQWTFSQPEHQAVAVRSHNAVQVSEKSMRRLSCVPPLGTNSTSRREATLGILSKLSGAPNNYLEAAAELIQPVEPFDVTAACDSLVNPPPPLHRSWCLYCASHTRPPSGCFLWPWLGSSEATIHFTSSIGGENIINSAEPPLPSRMLWLGSRPNFMRDKKQL